MKKQEINMIGGGFQENYNISKNMLLSEDYIYLNYIK